MVTIEKTEGSDIYIFHGGSSDEIKIKWSHNNDGLPRNNPPFVLENDILSYVNDIEDILRITIGDSIDIVEKRFRGLNNVLTRIIEENEGHIWDINVKCNEGDDLVLDECRNILAKGGIDSSHKTLEEILPLIKNLVDCEYGYVKVYDDIFCVRDWWLNERKYGLFPGAVVLFVLWKTLDSYVEDTYLLFEKIGHRVNDVTPAFVTYRMSKRQKDGAKKIQSALNHPIYTVTGIRYHMGDNLSDNEKTTAARQYLSGLERGQKVMLEAEPDNPADNKAIAVYIDIQHIGYIARENTDEVLPLLDNDGQCDAMVEGSDGHVTLFVSIPNAPSMDIANAERSRQLPESPLGETVRLPFTKEEHSLQLIAKRLIKTEVNDKNIHTIIDLANRYVPYRKISICYDDTLWRDKISKILYRVLYGSHLLLPLKKEERKLVLLLYEIVWKTIGDMRSEKEHWPERVFAEHLARLRNDESINHLLYERYCDAFLDGKSFAKADKILLTSEYERLRNWLKKMKWKELSNPNNLQTMGLKAYQLGLSRVELYDLYSVLLLIEKLEQTKNDSIDIHLTENDSCASLRDETLDKLINYAAKGKWVNGIKTEDITEWLKMVLGKSDELIDEYAELSEKLWYMLEKGDKGNSCRIDIVWANIVGFLKGRGFFTTINAAELSRTFFGDNKQGNNINKGANGRLNKVEPLLEHYLPKLPSKR